VTWGKYRTVGPQILGTHRTKFRSPHDLVPGICTPLFHAVVWKLVAIWRTCFFSEPSAYFAAIYRADFFTFILETYLGLSLAVFPTKHHCSPWHFKVQNVSERRIKPTINKRQRDLLCYVATYCVT
jgi:hypothetical protein